MDYCKDILKLPLEFQFQHMPFRLIGPKCLSPGETTERVRFYDCHLGQGRSVSLRQCVTKWAEEKSIPMCVLSSLILSQCSILTSMGVGIGTV